MRSSIITQVNKNINKKLDQEFALSNSKKKF
jgi:hypothetical protein